MSKEAVPIILKGGITKVKSRKEVDCFSVQGLWVVLRQVKLILNPFFLVCPVKWKLLQFASLSERENHSTPVEVPSICQQ